MPAEIQFRYFTPVRGCAVARYGTGSVIGARLTSRGYEWDEDAIVAIPAAEVRRYVREYEAALRGTPRGGPQLVERTREEYEAWASRKAPSSASAGQSGVSGEVGGGESPPAGVPEEIAARSSGPRKKRKAGGEK